MTELSRTKKSMLRLENAVVLVLVLIFLYTAITRIQETEALMEPVAVFSALGQLRSLLGTEVAQRVSHAGGVNELYALDGSNPMHLYASFGLPPPANYLGELRAADPEAIAPGRWYFDEDEGYLVYRPVFGDRLRTSLQGAPRIRFRITIHFDDRNRNGVFDTDEDLVESARLEEVEPYSWANS